MPSIDQVWATIPTAFKLRRSFQQLLPLLIVARCSLRLDQICTCNHLATWSRYKHHSTVKFLVACNPNGTICFISPGFVGLISDVKLTKLNRFLEILEDKPGISIMADRDFTIKDLLFRLHIELNILAFLNEQKLLPSIEVVAGRKIASLRIHV